MVDKFQVFIAGGAAHSHPPYGGFGLNNGLEDAANLGWRLAARLDGWGGEALLRSYTEERRPVFVEIGRDFIAVRIELDRAFLEEYSPERDHAEFERAWKARMERVSSRAQVYEPHQEGSSVVMGPPGGVCSAHGKHTFTARNESAAESGARQLRPRTRSVRVETHTGAAGPALPWRVLI